MSLRLHTLLAEEVRDNARDHALILAVLAVACAGVQAVTAVPAAFGTPSHALGSLTLVLALADLALAPVIVTIDCLARYWRTMYGPRGYLTMMLPVRGRTIVAARAVYALSATAAALVLSVGGTLLTLRVQERVPGGVGGQVGALARRLLEGWPHALVVGGAAFAVVALACGILMVMAVMSLAAQERFGRLGLGAVAIGLVLLYLVDQVVRLVGTFLVPLALDLETLHIRLTPVLTPTLDALHAGTQPTLVGLGYGPCLLIETAVMMWLGVRAVERHTSLR